GSTCLRLNSVSSVARTASSQDMSPPWACTARKNRCASHIVHASSPPDSLHILPLELLQEARIQARRQVPVHQGAVCEGRHVGFIGRDAFPAVQDADGDAVAPLRPPLPG